MNQGSVRVEQVPLLIDTLDENIYDVSYSFPANKPISYNRNKLVKDFLETDADFLLMLDDDCIGDERLIKLADYDKDVIGGVCFGFMQQQIIPFCLTKNEMGTYDLSDEFSLNTGVIEVDAIGSGCMMIKREVLENIPSPFLNEYDPEGIKTAGLDLAFCRRAKEQGYRIWCNTDLLVSHWTTVDLKQMWLTNKNLKNKIFEAYEKGRQDNSN